MRHSQMSHKKRQGKYYKDSPEAVRRRNANKMYINGEVISKLHPLHKAGKYASWQDAWNNKELDRKTTAGSVYAIGSPAWPTWIKIGKAVDPHDRLNGYQTSSPFRDYFLIHSRIVEDRNKAESAIHEKLYSEGFLCRSEWFCMTHEDAIKVIDNISLEDTQKDMFNESNS